MMLFTLVLPHLPSNFLHFDLDCLVVDILTSASEIRREGALIQSEQNSAVC